VSPSRARLTATGQAPEVIPSTESTKLDTKATRALEPSSVAIMQPGTRHFAWTKEETVVQVYGVGPWTVAYVNPAADPRKK